MKIVLAIALSLCTLVSASTCKGYDVGSCMSVQDDATSLLQVQGVVARATQRMETRDAKEKAKVVSNSFHFWGHIARRSPILLEQKIKVQTPSSELYNLAAGTNAATYSQWGQDTMLLPILQQLGKGFFVESGAFDGERDSNTLYLELNLGWRGLLVEPDPNSFSKLLGKNRRAYAYHGCLSPSDHAENLQFSTNTDGRVSMIEGDGNYLVEAQPLHALMERVGKSSVDFWSLDVEGSESHILRSTDFSKVEVGVLLIEMNKSDENNREIRKVMDKEGFKNIGHSIYPDGDGILDQVFVNPKYFQKRGLLVPSSRSLAPKYRN